MNDNLVSDRSPFASLFRIVLLLLFGFVLLGPALGLLVVSFFFEGDMLQAMSNPAGHPEIRNGILISQGIASAVGLILLPAYYLKFFEHRGLLPFYRDEKQWTVLVAALGLSVVCLSIAISPIVAWNANIQFPEWASSFGSWVKETEAMAEAIIKSITGNLTPFAFIFTFIVIAIIPAIGEELVFRGLIQTELQRAVQNPHIAIWIASILFSAFHLQFLGFVPRLLIGAFLGYLYYWSGNLWVPMIGHFFNNGIQLAGLYLYQEGLLSFDVESTESAPWPMVMVSIILLALLFYYMKNYFASRSTPRRDFA